MAVITAAQAGNWSATATWTGGAVPGNGDEARLNSYAVVMDIARVPAGTGTLASLNSKDGAGANTAGQLTIAMNTVGSCEIHATEILGASTANGIDVNGAAPAATLTIYCETITGGTGTAGKAVRHNSSATLILATSGTTLTIAGGTGASAYCVYNTSTGAITIDDATINGGGGSAGNGNNAIFNYSTGPVTLTNCTVTGSATAAAVWNRLTGVVTFTTCDLVDGTYPAFAGAGTSAIFNLGAACSYTVKTTASTVALVESTSYTLTSGIVWPAEANVSTVEAAWGPTGAEYAGSLNMALYTLISGVAAAADVRNGTARYSGGDNGTCYVPAAGDVQFGVSVDATTGTFTSPAVGKVNSDTSWGAGGVEFTGTLNMALYTLISGIVTPADVRKDVPTYTDGPAGGLTGCVDSTGDLEASGIIDNGGGYHATTGLAVTDVADGVSWNDGDGSHEGTLAAGGGLLVGPSALVS